MFPRPDPGVPPPARRPPAPRGPRELFPGRPRSPLTEELRPRPPRLREARPANSSPASPPSRPENSFPGPPGTPPLPPSPPPGAPLPPSGPGKPSPCDLFLLPPPPGPGSLFPPSRVARPAPAPEAPADPAQDLGWGALGTRLPAGLGRPEAIGSPGAWWRPDELLHLVPVPPARELGVRDRCCASRRNRSGAPLAACGGGCELETAVSTFV